MRKLTTRRACEIRRKVRGRGRWVGRLLVILAVLWAAGLLSSGGGARPAALQASAQPEAQSPAEPEPAEHGESIWATASRLANFAILAGALVYFLRSPLAQYLRERSTQIRQDLIAAAQLRESASQQLQEIERRMQALPGELQALKKRGAEEVAAEEARIHQLADVERKRLLAQTKREIDLQVRAAQRDLLTLTADLAVKLAGDRIKASLSPDDQMRLVDRYLTQMHDPAGPAADAGDRR